MRKAPGRAMFHRTMFRCYWLLYFTGIVLVSYIPASDAGKQKKNPFSCPVDPPCRCTVESTADFQSQFRINIICKSIPLHDIPEFRDIDTKNGTSFTINKLILRDNFIGDIRNGSFVNVQVKILDLARNIVGDYSLNTGAFRGLEDSLEDLNLKANEIETLPNQELSRLRNLKNLNLGYNRMPYGLKKGAFEGLHSLRKLILKQCRIASVDFEAFSGLDNLKTLILLENKLFEFPVAIRNLTNLETLDLGTNFIEFIPEGVFENLSKLKQLFLSRNLLGGAYSINVSAFIGLNHALEQLTLSNCRLEVIPGHAIRSLRKLRELDLQNNYIELIPAGTFNGLAALEKLWIGGNKKMSFDSEMFHGITSTLRFLSIRNMKLEILPIEQLKELVALKWLDASENRFTVIGPDFFKGIHAWRYTIMESGINDISEDAFDTSITSLDLDLRKNSITNISFVREVCMYNAVHLNENPVACDCHVFWLVTAAHRFHVTGTCSSPEDVDSLAFDSTQLIEKLEALCANQTTSIIDCSVTTERPNTNEPSQIPELSTTTEQLKTKHRGKTSTSLGTRKLVSIITMIMLPCMACFCMLI